jgi:HSP20 family molecular chaperone IbpA
MRLTIQPLREFSHNSREKIRIEFSLAGKREWKEEAKTEEKNESPLHTEKMHIYKTVKFPVEIKPEGVEAILKNGVLEITLRNAEAAKKFKLR